MARWNLMMAPAAFFLVLSAAGCANSDGQVRGHVLVFSPVAHPGSTTTVPVARFSSTVLVEQGKQVVARQTVVPGGQFHFSLASGSYDFRATGVPFCHASGTIVAGRAIVVNVRCVEP
jgi:hypothetical protein